MPLQRQFLVRELLLHGKRLAHRGFAQRMLRATTAHAFANGTDEIEGYPITASTGEIKVPAFVWTGLDTMFATVGFSAIANGTAARRVFVIKIPSPNFPPVQK